MQASPRCGQLTGPCFPPADAGAVVSPTRAVASNVINATRPVTAPVRRGLPEIPIFTDVPTIIARPRLLRQWIETATGVVWLAVLPVASWPYVLSPQDQTWPAASHAYAALLPTATPTALLMLPTRCGVL